MCGRNRFINYSKVSQITFGWTTETLYLIQECFNLIFLQSASRSSIQFTPSGNVCNTPLWSSARTICNKKCNLDTTNPGVSKQSLQLSIEGINEALLALNSQIGIFYFLLKGIEIVSSRLDVFFQFLCLLLQYFGLGLYLCHFKRVIG